MLQVVAGLVMLLLMLVIWRVNRPWGEEGNRPYVFQTGKGKSDEPEGSGPEYIVPGASRQACDAREGGVCGSAVRAQVQAACILYLVPYLVGSVERPRPSIK